MDLQAWKQQLSTIFRLTGVQSPTETNNPQTLTNSSVGLSFSPSETPQVIVSLDEYMRLKSYFENGESLLSDDYAVVFRLQDYHQLTNLLLHLYQHLRWPCFAEALDTLKDKRSFLFKRDLHRTSPRQSLFSESTQTPG